MRLVDVYYDDGFEFYNLDDFRDCMVFQVVWERLGMVGLKSIKFELELELKIKLVDIIWRDDVWLEKLIEEFVRNCDRGIDKIKEVK